MGYATENSRQEYVQSHDLAPEVEQAILNGRVVEGMTHDQVVAALGKYNDYNESQVGESRRLQLVYEATGTYDRAYVYLETDEFGYMSVTGWQNVCKLSRFCNEEE